MERPMSLPRFLRWSLIPMLGLVLVAAVRLWPVDAEARRIRRGDVVAEVLGVGALESAREVGVSFEASGRVTSLVVDEGAMVAEGELLGTLDASDAARELSVAAAAEEAAAAAVRRAVADLERSRAGLALASADRVRADRLFTAAVIDQADYEATLEREARTQAETDALEAALRQAEHNREIAARTRQIRAAQVADGRLLSPLDGLVIARRVEVGQLVSPGAPAFTIVATDAMQVSAWVDETALGRLAPGQPARLVFRSEEGRSFAGEVARVGREVDRQTHELLVDVTALELPARFAIGQRADVWIEVDRRADVASAPRGWCDDGCLVVEAGRVERRAVTLGLLGRERVELLSGLAEDALILAPGTPLGRRVRATESP